MKNNLVLVIIAVIMGAGGGFIAGMKYQQTKQPSKPDFQAMRGMRRPDTFGNGQDGGARMVRGEVISQDEEGVTIKLPDDSSKIILISENTTINKTTEGSKDDLEAGKQIVVFGQENSDKSVSATNIQLNFGFHI